MFCVNLAPGSVPNKKHCAVVLVLKTGWPLDPIFILLCDYSALAVGRQAEKSGKRLTKLSVGGGLRLQTLGK